MDPLSSGSGWHSLPTYYNYINNFCVDRRIYSYISLFQQWFRSNSLKLLLSFSQLSLSLQLYRFKLLPMNFKTLKLTLQHAFFSFFFPPQIFAHVSRTLIKSSDERASSGDASLFISDYYSIREAIISLANFESHFQRCCSTCC